MVKAEKLKHAVRHFQVLRVCEVTPAAPSNGVKLNAAGDGRRKTAAEHFAS